MKELKHSKTHEKSSHLLKTVAVFINWKWNMQMLKLALLQFGAKRSILCMFISTHVVAGTEDDGMRSEAVGVNEEMKLWVPCGDGDGGFSSWFSWVCDGKLEKLVNDDGRATYTIVEGDDDEADATEERVALLHFFWWEESDLLYVFGELSFLWFDMNNKCLASNSGSLM